jgi:GNAT superfamily N-acetyltransferase
VSINLRVAKLSDLPHLYDICRVTGNSGGDCSDLLSDAYIIGQYFCAPYLHYEIDSCFVVDEGCLPGGYIIGVSDSNDFNTWMNSSWLPSIRAHYPSNMKVKSDLEAFLVELIHQDCVLDKDLSEYPAHLHIDLLAQYQNQGLGRRLMQCFLDSLREKKVSGVHLGVDPLNKNAVAFYQKLGFSEIKRQPGTIFMGLEIVPYRCG